MRLVGSSATNNNYCYKEFALVQKYTCFIVIILLLCIYKSILALVSNQYNNNITLYFGSYYVISTELRQISGHYRGSNAMLCSDLENSTRRRYLVIQLEDI